MASARSIESLFMLIAALLLCIVAVEATKTNFIDEDGVESIARSVCGRTQGSYTQIANVSTILQLVAFFDNLPSGRNFETCRDKHLNAVHLLYDVVSTRNDNACSDEKISQVEKFHHTYISKTKKDKKQQKLDNTLEAPKILKNFFYHYATKVAIICKNSLIRRMNEAAPSEKNLEYRRDGEKLDYFLKEFSRKLGSTSGSFKTYGDITLLWNYIDKLPIKEDNTYIYPEGERIALQVEGAKTMRAFQSECLSRLKPVYGALALPVIRLIDLGYYLDDEPFALELAERDDLRRLFGVAQVCEFILPVRIIADNNPSLQHPGQMTLLTKEQASAIPRDDEDLDKSEPVVIPDDHGNSMVGLNYLDSATSEGAHWFVKNVRTNIKAREITVRSFFSKMAAGITDKAKSMYGKIFYKRKSEKKDLIMEPNSFSENVFESIKTYSRALVGNMITAGPAGIFIAIFFILGHIIKSIFKGIMIAMFAIVAFPIVACSNAVRATTGGIDKYLMSKLI